MSMDALVAPLRHVPLFEGLKPLQITEIARMAERIIFQSGQTIIEEGTDGDGAFLIVSGEALRTKGPTLGDEAEPVAQGSLVAEMTMLIETEHSSTIIAKGPVRTLKITRAGLLAQMENDPTLAEHFVGKITQRLHVLASHLKELDETLATDSPPRAAAGRHH